uniref:Uncharacterized protein n=1 Tax=Plectus sambesii TaxID=2011161 RepID=A0A914USF8_9BILA
MAVESLIDRLRRYVYSRYQLDDSLPLVDSVRQRVRPQRKHLHYGRQELEFKWPPNLPTEVRKLVGPERYDPSNPQYTMPFFWRREPATTYWGLVICAIECGFGLVCLLLNLIHFGVYLPGYKGYGWPGEIFAITLMQLTTFFVFKVLFVFGLLCKNPRLLRWQLLCQYATCVVLFFNAGFTIAADFGGYREQKFYIIRNPPLIRLAAFLSFIFIFVQLYLRIMAWPVCKFIIDTQRFKLALHNAKWRYKKRVYFTYCSIVQESLKEEQTRIARANNELKRLTAMEESFKQIQESYKSNGTNGTTFPAFLFPLAPDVFKRLEEIEDDGTGLKVVGQKRVRIISHSHSSLPTTKSVKGRKKKSKARENGRRKTSLSSNSSAVTSVSSVSQPLMKKNRNNRDTATVRIQIELDQKTIRRAVKSQLRKRTSSHDRAPLTLSAKI